MANEGQELPVVEEPKKEEKPAVDIDGILGIIEKAGVTGSDDLDGKLRASKEAGKLANMLGEVRNENRELKEMLKSLQESSRKTVDDFGLDSQPIDLEGSIEKVILRVEEKKQKMEAMRQAKMLETWNSITQDEDYHLVKPVWEEKLKDPNFVFSINSGQIDPFKAYAGTVREFYKGIAKKAGDTIRALKGDDIKPPHIESGDRVPRSPKPLGEKEEKIKSLKEKVGKGYVPTDDELVDLLGKLTR